MFRFVKLAHSCLVVVTAVTMLGGCSSPHPTTPPRTAAEFRTQAVSYTNEMISHTGSANSAWSGPGAEAGQKGSVWNPTAAVIDSMQCDHGSGGVEFVVALLGPRVDDPVAKTKGLLAQWKDLGYRTESINPTNPTDPSKYTAIGAHTPDGAEIAFTASTASSGILVVTACTADPKIVNLISLGPSTK
ncbi:MAG: hypothetical protein ABI067_18025 [Leifsonia sp.]